MGSIDVENSESGQIYKNSIVCSYYSKIILDRFSWDRFWLIWMKADFINRKFKYLNNDLDGINSMICL